MEKVIPCKRNEKKARVAILISEKKKKDFTIKTVKRDKEGYYIMIKGSIQEEDIRIVNIYAPNIGAPKYIMQVLTDMKGEINNNTVIKAVLREMFIAIEVYFIKQEKS